jgi:hypothetical protein
MTSKERILCAINKEKPDRLPAAIHQWQPYHLNKYMKGMSDIEANKACGLDAAINFYEEIPTESNDWRVSCSRTQKEGILLNIIPFRPLREYLLPRKA